MVFRPRMWEGDYLQHRGSTFVGRPPRARELSSRSFILWAGTGWLAWLAGLGWLASTPGRMSMVHA